MRRYHFIKCFWMLAFTMAVLILLLRIQIFIRPVLSAIKMKQRCLKENHDNFCPKNN